MKWKLHDKKWNIVAKIELPDDAPDVVIFEGRIFHYDERVERYVSPTIYVVASDPASALEEPKIVNAPPGIAAIQARSGNGRQDRRPARQVS
jgi:uridine kinase